MARNPLHISDVLTEFLVRYGYTRQRWAGVLEDAWHEAAGPEVSVATRVGRLHRGVLEVLVASSPLLQELTFQKGQLLQRLRRLLPDQPIHDLRFRLARIG